MTRGTMVAAVTAFLAVLYTVPGVQAILEIRRVRQVQFIDAFEDWMVTPVRRRVRADAGLDSATAMLDAVRAAAEKARAVPADSSGSEPDIESLVGMTDEVMVKLDEVRKRILQTNRHVTQDSTIPVVVSLDSVRALVRAAYGAVQTGDAGAAFDRPAADAAARLRGIAAAWSPFQWYQYPYYLVSGFFQSIFSGKYWRAYEREMEESCWAANLARPYLLFTWYAVLGNAGEKAVAGRGEWLYYKPDVEYLVRPYLTDPRSIVVDPNDRPLVDDPFKAIVRFRDQLSAAGIELLVVIVPGKPSIYPDMLHRSVPPQMAGKVSHTARVIADLRQAGVEVVDLLGPFAEERARDSQAGDSMYLRQDTHWRARGVRLASRLVAERIRACPWYQSAWETTEYALDSVTVARIGDVGTMSTLPDIRLRALRLSFAAESTLCYQVYQVQRDGDGVEVSRALYNDEFSRSHILVLGDSFSRIYQTDAPRSAGWISHLACELKQPVASIVSDGGASTLVREKLARKAGVLRGKKLVVWEFVERDLRFGAEGWKDVALEL